MMDVWNSNIVAPTVIVMLAFVSSTYFLVARNYHHGILSLIMRQIVVSYRTSGTLKALARLLYDRKCPRDMPPLDSVERVSESVWRVLGLNPGSHTLQGTNTWLVGRGAAKILIDTGEDVTSEKYVAHLVHTVFPMTNTTHLSAILLTHGHGDHAGGVTAILAEMKRLGRPAPKIFKRRILHGHYSSFDYLCEDICEAQSFIAEVAKEGQVQDSNIEEEGVVLRAVLSPGHTDDHVAFTLKEGSSTSLFSGDCVLGCGTTVFDDLHEYMKSLCKLKELMLPCDGRDEECIVTRIYPGHGPVIKENSLQKVEEYISHRTKRENEIYSVLQTAFLLRMFEHQNTSMDIKGDTASRPDNSAHTHLLFRSSWEITTKVYGKLNLFVKLSAQWNCLHHLQKLLKEKKVVYCWPDLWRMNELEENKEGAEE